MSDHPEGPKIVTLEPKDPVRASAHEFNRNLELILDNQKAIAKVRRAAYLALIEAGFNDEQALKLCR